VINHVYISAEVNKGRPTKEYLLSIIFPRPRDLIFVVEAAVEYAVNRRHHKVTENDMLQALSRYSEYAYQAVLVENGITVSELEAVLIELAGTADVIDEVEIRGALSQAGIQYEREEAVIEHLAKLGFLGLEIRRNEFEFVDDFGDVRHLIRMSRRVADAGGGTRRFQIHPAFHPVLQIHSS